MIFKNNKVYDVLKYLALIVFNALGVFYKTLAIIWKLPYGNEVALTCSAIALLIGTLIGISSYTYNKTELIDEYDQEEENSLEFEDGEDE